MDSYCDLNSQDTPYNPTAKHSKVLPRFVDEDIMQAMRVDPSKMRTWCHKVNLDYCLSLVKKRASYEEGKNANVYCSDWATLLKERVAEVLESVNEKA